MLPPGGGFVQSSQTDTQEVKHIFTSQFFFFLFISSHEVQNISPLLSVRSLPSILTQLFFCVFFTGRLLLRHEALLSCRLLVRPGVWGLRPAEPAELGHFVQRQTERLQPHKLIFSTDPLHLQLTSSPDDKGFFFFPLPV